MRKNRDIGPMRVPDDERRISGPVKSYKLPKKEIDKIFKDVKPEEVPTGLSYMIQPKQKRKEDLDEQEGIIESILAE
jgi:hypothetical protein